MFFVCGEQTFEGKVISYKEIPQNNP